MFRISYGLVTTLLIVFISNSFAQVSYLSRVDTVQSGGTYVLSQLGDAPFVNDPPRIMGEQIPQFILPAEPNNSNLFNQPMVETVFIEAPSEYDSPNGVGDNAIILNKLTLFHSNNIIPPDPTIAVGPDHVVALTNHSSGIFIYDKEGNLLRNVSSNQFWSGIWPSQDGDPQVIYDHYAGRWVIVFMQIDDGAQVAGDLLAYSDDESPFGTWYIYRLPSMLWGDFPQVGFDHQAIYIAANAFSFSGFGQYGQVKIISKAELYASNGGPVSYRTLYNISLPGSSQLPFNIRPSFQYSISNDHYMLWANRGGAGFYGFYKISNPLTAPVLTGVQLPTTYYYNTPTANQLGGGTPRIESGGSAIRTAPIFRDGYLYATHSAGNSSQTAANIRYVKIDVSTNQIVESVEYGTNNFYHIYPALCVDKEHNIVITSSRSSNNHYMGAYFYAKRAGDPPGLSNAYELQAGLGNYIVTFGGTRNRWGDYMGIFIDPSTEFNFWMITQFASNTNQYSMAIAEVRLQPYTGIYPYLSTLDYDLGSTELGDTSATVTVYLANYGEDDLVISNIPQSVGDFHRISDFTFPLTLETFDSVAIEVAFIPTSVGAQSEFMAISNNSTSFTGVNLTSVGYIAQPALSRVLYGITGSQNGGNLSTFDLTTGAGVNVGPSGFDDLFDIEISNNSNKILAIRTMPIASEVYRINADDGEAFLTSMINISELYSLAYDTSGVLYATSRVGGLFTIDTTDWSATQIATLPYERVAIAFNPLTNELWGSVRNFIGTPRDRIVKFNPSTGDTLFVGRTGFNANTTDIAFDEDGKLYGVKGSGNVISDLFTINQTTGTGTLIGATGIKDIRAIGYSIAQPTSVDDNIDLVPVDFALAQNYPNPFNPSTTINFTVPNSAAVKLTVYNILGETVNVLINKEMQTGSYNVIWNADDFGGRKVSSGVYFYELKASSADGKDFNQIRKMVLLK